MATPSEVVYWVQKDRAVSFVHVACAVFVIYDHMTTFDLELDFIWKKKKWTPVHYFFLVNRYVGDTSLIYSSTIFVRHVVANTQNQCVSQAIVQGILAIIILGAMQGIMVHRICSMHFGNMMIYRILVLSLVIEFVLVLVIQCLVGLVLMKEDVPNPVPGYSLCTTPPYTAWMATFWIPIVFFESLVLYLAIRVGLRYRAHIRYSQTVVSTRQSLAYIMCRDSILFPFMSLIMCIIGFISNTRFSPLDIEMAMSVSGSVLCIIGPRLILNLREAYYQPFTEEMKMEVESDKAVVDLPP